MADEGKWRLVTAYKHQQRTDVPNGCLILPNVVDGVRILHTLASLPTPRMDAMAGWKNDADVFDRSF